MEAHVCWNFFDYAHNFKYILATMCIATIFIYKQSQISLT